MKKEKNLEPYVSPLAEVITVEVERGFAQSGDLQGFDEDREYFDNGWV